MRSAHHVLPISRGRQRPGRSCGSCKQLAAGATLNRHKSSWDAEMRWLHVPQRFLEMDGEWWRWVMRKKTRILDDISAVGCCGWFARNLTFCLSGAADFFSISAVEVTTICFTMPMFRWRVGSASCSWTPAMAMTSTPIPRGIRWTAAPGQIWKTLTWCGSRGWRGCGPWRQRWAQEMCSSCRVAGGTMCSRSLKIRSPSLPWWFQGGFLHLHIGVARIRDMRERTICPSRPHAMLFFGEVLPSNEYDWVCHLTRDDAQSTGSHHFWHFDDKRLTFHGKPVNQSKNLSCPATFLFKHLQTQHYGSHFFQKQKQSIEHRSNHICFCFYIYIYYITLNLLYWCICLFVYLFFKPLIPSRWAFGSLRTPPLTDLWIP